MKALSIIQPWAELIACGAKTIETRSWATNYRGNLAIHASKRRLQKWCRIDLMENPYFKGHVKNALSDWPDQYGAVIAIAELVSCQSIKMTEFGPAAGDGLITEREQAFGNYTDPGRFAWRLILVTRIKPIPAKGRLGLWNWEPSA